MARLRSRYWGPFRQEWYSICSVHYHHKPVCRMCQTGQWRNVLRQRASSFVYKRWPGVWRAWANRPFWNGDSDFLEAAFPRLRRGGFWEWLHAYF